MPRAPGSLYGGLYFLRLPFCMFVQALMASNVYSDVVKGAQSYSGTLHCPELPSGRRTSCKTPSPISKPPRCTTLGSDSQCTPEDSANLHSVVGQYARSTVHDTIDSKHTHITITTTYSRSTQYRALPLPLYIIPLSFYGVHSSAQDSPYKYESAEHVPPCLRRSFSTPSPHPCRLLVL